MLYKVKIKGKYGFINEKGDLVVDPQFDGAGDSRKGSCIPVRKKKKMGVMGLDGSLVVPCHIPCDGFSHAFYDGMLSFHQKDKYGFINEKGELKVPCIYDNTATFNSGISIASVNLEKKVSMGIDQENRVVIPPSEYEFWLFSENRIRVGRKKSPRSSVRYFGYMDNRGEIVIPCEYTDGGYFFCNGVTEASKHPQKRLYSLINRDGRILTDECYFCMDPFFCPVSSFVARGKKPGKNDSGVLRNDGVELFRTSEVQVEKCTELCIFFRYDEDGFCGVMDYSGNIIHEPTCISSVSSFFEGFSTVVWEDKNKKDYVGYIDEAGNFMTDLKFHYAYKFMNGMGLVEITRNNFGYINAKGELFPWKKYEK